MKTELVFALPVTIGLTFAAAVATPGGGKLFAGSPDNGPKL
jgi:hypothetical protein